MYYQPETKQIFSGHSAIRAALSNVFFPATIDDDMLAFIGVYPLAYTLPPVEAGQIAEPAAVEEVDGVWTQTWTVRDATPEELAGVPVPVPQTVTMRQARLALLAAGVLAQIESAIAGMPHPEQDVARIEWDYGKDVERNSPTVALMAAALNLDDTALDQLFITAAGL